MSRMSFFGGVYSNHLALDRVLAEIEARGTDLTWCLGDLGGFGPHPDRAVEVIRDAGIPTLRGNVDDSIAHGRSDCACGYTDPRDHRFSQISYDFAAANTSAEHKRWMRDLPEQARIEMDGFEVLLCHGSPRRVNEFLWESTCSDAFLEWLCESHRCDVIVCSHSGLPWHRALPSGRQVINAGVIGRPANNGRTEVWVAELRSSRGGAGDRSRAPCLEVEFREVAYDFERLAREMEEEKLPAEFVETIRTGWWTTCLENLPAKERARGRF